ncbi:thermonuclease family protein [Bdellovibrio svalbardensis]|uniref:Thermonuclease family protein n=1 Tax=Bdellovibrio svalbardensis TaxID=2972972 RepID=A0ABT6DIA2_9BACT|nr:thermonuclease family protein [Bdellovibrio svalbardensis]MDG0815659.1 thermonuclease family protein [Bdellovibrio svalbardensis]
MRSASKSLLGALIVLAPLWSLADAITGRVIDVHDGDTLTVQIPGDITKYKVRMLGVDTPEVDFFSQTQGESAFLARDFVRGLAPIGSTATVTYDTNGFDKHNRILGRIVVNNIEINRELLKNGLGYLYFIYPFDKKIVAEYSELARSAAVSSKGLFSPQFNDIAAPYEFRLSVRNQQGTNMVGDLETKILYSQKDITQVPVWRRVFFSDPQLAVRNGYKIK